MARDSLGAVIVRRHPADIMGEMRVWRHTATALAAFTVAASVACALVPAADAAVLDLTVEQMTGAAAVVVLADTLSVTPRVVHADGRETVETAVVLLPVVTLKGRVGDELALTVPGGETPLLGVWVSDSPRFLPGRRVLVFLDGQGRVVAGPRGHMVVEAGLVDTAGQPWGLVRDRVLAAQGRLQGPVLEGPVAASADAASVAAAAPVITSIAPGSASAGTGTRVTIRGTGFGSAMGSGRVDFFYRRDSRTGVVSTVRAPILSWSDSSVVVEVPVGTVAGYPASAGSGPVSVTNGAGATSPGHDFEVTFSYGGIRWPTDRVGYRVSAPGSALEAMADAAASTWSAASAFTLVDEGTASGPAPGRNDIYWANLSAGYLGQAYISYDPVPGQPGRIRECDLALNTDFPWGTGAGDTYDVQSVTLHEVGHWLNLRDLYGVGDSSEVMYGVGTRGAQKRILHAHDIAGIRYIYGQDWIGVDSEPPITTADGVPPGWTTSPVTLALSATDDLSGVHATYYRIGPGAAIRYQQPVLFAADTSTTLTYWSVDRAGNTEAAGTARLRLDRTPPFTTSNARTFLAGETWIDLTPSDSTSGVERTVWSLDGGEPTEGVRVHVEDLGAHALTFRSVDVAGNAEPSRTAAFTVVEPGGTAIERISGVDRYSTAAETSRRAFASARTVVLATGAGHADALAAAGLAGALDAPLLLSRPGRVPAPVVEEIRRLGASEIVVVGGPGAVTDEAVASACATLGIDWRRVHGADRYSTAALVAGEMRRVTGSPSGEVFLVCGDGFADALAASPYACSLDSPILLTRRDSVPAVTAAAVRACGAATVTVVGGTAAVSDAAAASLGEPWVRVAGATRYATAVALVRHAMGAGWTLPSTVGIATGETFPDALGGGVAVGAHGGAMLLTPPDRLGADARAFLLDCLPAIRVLAVYGGEAAVSSPAYASVCSLAGP